MSGRLYGIGCGPGDPELMTLKAVRLLGKAGLVAYPTAGEGRGVALAIARPHLRPDQELVPLTYPATAGPEADAADYPDRMRAFYDEAAAMLARRLEAGSDVAILCEGDPFFYGSFMYWHARLSSRFEVEVVPGISSVMAAPVAAGMPLCQREDVVSVIPATLPEAVLVERLAEADAAVVMKLGRTFAKLKRALGAAGVLDRAVYVERATWAEQRVLPAREVDPESVPYFSVVVLPTRFAP